MVQNLQKFLLSKLHNKLFSSKQTCTSKCICSDFLASCISEHNAILPLVKPSKITTSFDSHKCCTQARWIRASESHTVSDSEALIHLAYVQHLWESKLVVILEGLTRGRIALCSEMQLARKSLQMHFDVHVCLLEKSLLCRFDSKNFCKFLHHFRTPKWGLKNGPKNAARI